MKLFQYLARISQSYRSVSYVQGQSPGKGLREYFYFIDHQGQLFLDDARIKNFTSCFKDKAFLNFFFKRVKRNRTDKYSDAFPWISPCGRELNYIHCDDLPVVFTSIESEKLIMNHCGVEFSVLFEPANVCMFPGNGRVYHPAPEKYGGVGLIRTNIAIELSKSLVYGDLKSEMPTSITYDGKTVELTNLCLPLLENMIKLLHLPENNNLI